ncbi:MAG: HAD-IA family hydrolase [Gemmatimonadota bacterium]
MTRPLTVLFDLDGTIVDSIELLTASMEHAFAGRTVRPTVAEWVAGIGRPLDDILRPWSADEQDLDLVRDRYRTFQHANHDAMTTAYPGAVETIRALHTDGHALGIVTSKLEVGARRSLALIGVESCFGVVVGIDATARHKPDPEPVRFALRALDEPAPRRAVFIGDSTHDMHAGRAAGVHTAAALWGPNSREALEPTRPDHWLAAYDDVRTVVRTLNGA